MSNALWVPPGFHNRDNDVAYDDFIHVKHPAPHDKTDWVVEEVHIRKNETGEIAIYINDSAIWNGEDGWSDYWWSEGNGSCDDNRYLSFERGKGNDPETGQVECGEGKYSINIYSSKTKKLIYKEFDEEIKTSGQ